LCTIICGVPDASAHPPSEHPPTSSPLNPAPEHAPHKPQNFSSPCLHTHCGFHSPARPFLVLACPVSRSEPPSFLSTFFNSNPSFPEPCPYVSLRLGRDSETPFLLAPQSRSPASGSKDNPWHPFLGTNAIGVHRFCVPPCEARIV